MTDSQDVLPLSPSSGLNTHMRVNSLGSDPGSESIDLPTPPPFGESIPGTPGRSAQSPHSSFSASSSDVEIKRPTPVISLPSSRLSERMRLSKLNALFQLPSDEERIDDWSAAMSKNILVQGRIYLFTNYICFFSKLFGDDSREVIKLSDVAQMSKKRNGIEIQTQTGERFFFTSFITRTKAFNTMLKAWERATMSSDSTDTSDKRKKVAPPTEPESADSSCDMDEGIVVDMKVADDETASSAVAEVVKESEPLSPHSATSDTPLEVVATALSSNEGETASEKAAVAKECKNGKDDEDSKGSKGSDSGENVSVRDDNLMYLWDPPPESTIHHDDVPMFETHHDHFDRVDLLQFFHLFYSDASGDFAENGHKALEEFDLVSELWTEKDDGGKQRLLQFNSVLHGIPIGPSKTRMTELQWYSLNTDTLIIHTVQNSLDVPYGDFFDVENSWEFARSLKGGVDVSVKAGVHWKKKTWLKSQVESTTLKKCKECHVKWCAAIKDYISFHPDQLGKRLVPVDVRDDGASGSKTDRSANSVIRRRKHKHKHHHKSECGDDSLVSPRPGETPRVPPVHLESLQNLSPTDINNNNGPRPKLVLAKHEKPFSSQHLVMMAVWLLTVLYLVARIMALERDVERLSNAQSPPSPPPPSPPPSTPLP